VRISCDGLVILEIDLPCLDAMYKGTANDGACPAILEMWTIRLGLLVLTLPVLEVEDGFNQRLMASWVVRIGWVRLMSRQA
jgi:hypothetical protein